MKEMSELYLVQHENVDEGYIEEMRIIGIYSSEKEAQNAIERVKKLYGFSDYLRGFQITKYILDKDQWVAGFKFMQ